MSHLICHNILSMLGSKNHDSMITAEQIYQGRDMFLKKKSAKRIEGQFFPGIIVFQNRSEEIVKCNVQETE